ncbi:nose resistant to fluoxetine protein 6-like [Parasteatoda tepidariorum]|uniref:nose resistant to fluoxetine protein 6-like n=1 Tax=Parasteatoda tepidariorum TaxID=114398 RepID=UPI0039BD39F9
MPAIFIPIKLILVVLLLHQTNGLRNLAFKPLTIPQHAKMVSGITQDNIILAWMNTEATLKKAYFKLIKSVITNSFDWSLTSNISHNCTNSLFEYLNGLRHMKTWAFKMFDSSGKIANGVFGGNPTAFGDFETCLDIESPSGKFKGQFCDIDFVPTLPERKMMSPAEKPIEIIDTLFEPGTLTDTFAKMANYLYAAQVRLNACLPSTCSKEDVRGLISSVSAYMKSENQLIVRHCHIKEELELTAMEIFIYALFIVLICLLVLGTLLEIIFRNKPKHDFQTKNKSAAIKALLCFSAYTNTIRLLKVDKNPDTLHMFHGLRVLSITWIIWSHSYLVVSYRAFDGAFRSRSLGKEFIFQLAPCGFLAVENFFFMSSVLLSYICVRIKGRISMPSLFLKRYLRLTPTMMLVVAFFAIIGRFGSGPLWKEIVADSLSKNCLERGWMNMFYLNNIFYSPKTVSFKDSRYTFRSNCTALYL